MTSPNTLRTGQGENSDPEGLSDLAIVLRDEFTSVASELDRHTRNVNIARLIGGLTAFAGGVTAFVGYALTSTLGSSAEVVALAGAGIVAAGGLAVAGANATKTSIENSKLKQLLARWSDFNETFVKKLEDKYPETLQQLKTELKRRTALGTGTAGIAAIALKVPAAVPQGGVLLDLLARVSPIVATMGGLLLGNVILICVSLYDLIDGSIQLHRHTGSKAGDYLRKLAQSLDDFARTGITPDFLPNIL